MIQVSPASRSDVNLLRPDPDELYEGHLSAEIEGDHQTVVSSRDFER